MSAPMTHCNLCQATQFELLIHKDGCDVVRCQRCELIFVANPPDDEQRQRLYSFESDYHTELQDDETSKAFHLSEAVTNLAVLRRHVSTGRLLDIGCSTGLFLRAAQDTGWPGQGLEYSADSSAIAREQHGLNVRTGELKPDTFTPGSFDVVTMWDVIEHVPDPQLTVNLIAHVVAPGGLLVLKTPDAGGWFPQASLRLAQRLDFWRHAEPPGHLYQFSQRTLSAMVEKAGFEVVARHSARIPIAYSFGPPRSWLRSVKWFIYCAAFIPMAWLGPFFGRGDDMTLVCRKRAT
jgi:2-polyprenyl-3-methyl-5-hydroxy-6-metoxy-1,4-benzoquinol methylase